MKGFCIAVALALLAACSSSSSGNTNNGGNTDTGNANGANSEVAATCSNETTANSCQDCCGYADELALLMVDAFDDCACNGTCKTQCASSYCSSTASGVSAECKECLPTCDAKAGEACKADSKCKPYGECTIAAQCEKLKGGLEDPNRR